MKSSPLCWLALLALLSVALSDDHGMGKDKKRQSHVRVVCTPDYMEAVVYGKGVRNFVTDGLRLADGKCRATEVTKKNIKFITPLDGCGTKHNITDDYLVYYNSITGDLVSSDNDSVITREHSAEMPFQCSYERRKVLSVQAYSPRRALISTKTENFGNFTFTMDMYKTDKYENTYDDGDYPVDVGIGQRVYLEVAVENENASLAVVPITCKATPTEGYNDKPQYVFINESCTKDKTMKYDFKESHVQRFSIAAFRFLPDYKQVFFHCQVTACPKGDSNSRCTVGCKKDDKTRRRRREAPLRDIDYDMYLGPVNLEENDKQTMGSAKGAPTSMITMITIIAAVLGVLVFALFVGLIVMMRRRQAPPKPQKLLVTDDA